MSENLLESKTLDEQLDFASDVAELVGGKTTQQILDEQKAKQAEVQEKKDEDATDKEAAQVTEASTETKEEPPVESPEGKPEESTESKDESPLDLKSLGNDITMDTLTEWKKAHENREEWDKRLRQRSMAIKFLEGMTPEQIDLLSPRLMPYISDASKVPDTPEKVIEDALTQVSDLIPDQITYKDDEDYEVSVPSEKYMPFIKKVVGSVIRNSLPELGLLRTSTSEWQTKYNQAVQELDTQRQANGALILESFYARNPEQAPSKVNDQESTLEAIMRIQESGVDHPEYDKVLRVEAAGKLVIESQNGQRPLTFDQAWEKLYGQQLRHEKRVKEANEADLKAQQENTRQEAPGQSVPPDPDQEKLAKLPPSREDMVDELFK